MKRAPVVLTGTALGLAGLIGVHTAGSSSALASGQSASPLATGTAAVSSTGSTSTQAASGSTTTASSASSTRTAVGQDIPYQFGDIQVQLTAAGSKITDIQVVSANVNDQRSASIDQYALPQLRSQALSAQSAKINGISGASYTSAAYERSLQSALDKLKA